MHGTMRKQQRARFKFDFPLLLAECLRHNCRLSHLAAWYYVDTLEVVKHVDGRKVADGCAKLQCLRAACGNSGTGRNHRALDDAIVLGDVVDHIAATLGITAEALLRPFVLSLDMPSSLVSFGLFLKKTSAAT